MTDQEVTVEINRVKASVEALLEARRAAERTEAAEYARRTFEKRFAEYQEGRLVMCDCHTCLRSYVLGAGPNHLCPTGSHQFWRDCWQPWVPE